MVGAADRLRRSAGPPLTRWPRLGQSGARKTAVLADPICDPKSLPDQCNLPDDPPCAARAAKAERRR